MADFGTSSYDKADKQEKTIAVGHFIRFMKTGNADVANRRYQNFFMHKQMTYNSKKYDFLPFGFSGVTVSSDGANLDASILLPSVPISRDWTVEGLRARWFVHVTTMLLDADATSLTTAGTHFLKLSEYQGQLVSGSWDEKQLVLNLNTVLDAVGADIPGRRLTQDLCGNLPRTTHVRVQ